MFNPISRFVVWFSLMRTDVWAGIEFERDGMPCILRFRPEYPLGISQFDYRFLVHIKWAYVSGRHKGMPSERDYKRMLSFEKKLNCMELDRTAFLMVASLANGVMDWLWYGRNEIEVLDIVNKRVCEFGGSSIEVSTREEGHWGTFFRMVPEDWLLNYRT